MGFEEVDGGHSYGVRSTEGENILEFVFSDDLIIGSTQFLKIVTPGHLQFCQS